MPIEESWLIDSVGFAIGSLAARDLAIDVGANRGDWSIELATLFKNVIAVEPDRRNPLFERTSGLGNVSIVWGAAYHTSGDAVLYKRQSPDQNSLLYSHPIGAGACADAPVVAKEEVKCFTLQEIAPGGADFVKIDVEGCEADVLAACNPETWARAAFIVECHDTFPEVSSLLSRLGKAVTRIRHPSPTAHDGHCWAIGMPL